MPMPYQCPMDHIFEPSEWFRASGLLKGHFREPCTPPSPRTRWEVASLSPGKGLHHQRSSRHAMVPLSDTSPHPEGGEASGRR
jgi:hypothetical protein